MINDLINATLRFVFPFHYQLLDLGITGDFDEADKFYLTMTINCFCLSSPPSTTRDNTL